MVKTERQASFVMRQVSIIMCIFYGIKDLFFPIWISCHQGKGEAIILAPFFHFHPFPKSFGLQHLHLFVDV